PIKNQLSLSLATIKEDENSRSFPEDEYQFDEFDIEKFQEENPWYTEEWFAKNKSKLDNYFDCYVTFKQARLEIMNEPRLTYFLVCLYECF
ncbi:MAG: hypothetical protein M0R16_05415, partial [Bacteroidales bacterium]|nr:hypothetical protein [Bacteroidales bacterium]